MSLDDNKTGTAKTTATASGAAKTSSNATGGAGGGGGQALPGGAGGGGGSSSTATIPVKNHVPSAVMEKLEEALAAAAKVSDGQKQGFALQRGDFEACVDKVRLLQDALARCAFAVPGPSAPPAAPGGPTGASAKVAPMPK